MPAINFQPQHGPAIQAGTKLLTLRKERRDGRDPAPIGKMLRLYTGLRKPGAALLLETVSIYRATVQLAETGIWVLAEARGSGPVATFLSRWIALDVSPARTDGCETFARMDGFDSYAALFAWHAANGRDGIGCVTRELISWRAPDIGDRA